MSRACIPFHILFDKDLSKNELIIYGLIEHMESDGKYAFFNNRTIAEKIGVSHESGNVRKMIARLTEKGYIKREHKEIPIKIKGVVRMEWKWCFNTVKSMVIQVENDDQGGVAEEPPLTGVAEEPPLTGVAEEPPYNNPSSIPPLTTTTQSSSSIFNEQIDKELIAMRNKYIPSDERDNNLFLRQCKWHVDLGSKEHTFNQRISGLKKIIRGGCFDAPGTYPKTKEAKQANEKVLWSNYQGYVNSPIEMKLREKGIATLMSFEAWKTKNE